MSTKLDLHGIIPAMITPFNTEGDICKPTTRILVNHLINQGANDERYRLNGREDFLQ